MTLPYFLPTASRGTRLLLSSSPQSDLMLKSSVSHTLRSDGSAGTTSAKRCASAPRFLCSDAMRFRRARNPSMNFVEAEKLVNRAIAVQCFSVETRIKRKIVRRGEV